MPGSNHDYETKFIKDLPFQLRDVSWFMLEKYPLKALITLQNHDGKPAAFEKIADYEWQMVLRAVILTKLTYFDLRSPFLGPEHIDFVATTFLKNFNHGNNLKDISQIAQNNYRYLGGWVEQLRGRMTVLNF